jgi:hypothetical protein
VTPENKEATHTCEENLMRTGSRRFTTGLVLAAAIWLSPLAPAASAQTANAPTGDWAAVESVTSGTKLSVKLKNGKTVEGRSSGASDTALSLSVGGKAVDLSRDDILRVYRAGGGSAKKAALIGLGVGAGAGAAVGAAGGDDDGFAPTRAQLAAGLAVLGAGAGALAGFAIGKGRHKRVLIYDAGRP